MTYKDISTLVSSIGLPYAYYQFPDDTPQAPPFICFLYEDDDDLAADNINYQRIRRVSLELYTSSKDFALENTVETVLNNAGLYYSRSEQYLDSERMMMVVYEFEVVVTDEQSIEIS